MTNLLFVADGEGCVCPDGQLLLGNECVESDQCGCVFDGKRFPVSLMKKIHFMRPHHQTENSSKPIVINLCVVKLHSCWKSIFQFIALQAFNVLKELLS